MTIITSYERKGGRGRKKVNTEYGQTDRQTKNSYRKVASKKETSECLWVFLFFLLVLSFNKQRKKEKQSGDLPNTMRLCLYLLFSLTCRVKSLFLLFQSFFFDIIETQHGRKKKKEIEKESCHTTANMKKWKSLTSYQYYLYIFHGSPIVLLHSNDD